MPNRPPTPKSGFNAQDILFALFRHKWKIILCSILGLVAAAVVYAKQRPVFESEAKLLVRYVLERNAMDTYETQSSAGGRGGKGVIAAEIEILSSADLATIVAEKLPDRTASTSRTTEEISSSIAQNLRISAAQDSNVIHLAYTNENRELCVEVLRALIQAYFEKHLEIHRSTGAFDFVTKQVDQARSRLRQTEDELNRIKFAGGVMSLPDTISSLEAQRGKAREDLMTTEALFSEQKALVEANRIRLGKEAAADESEPKNDTGVPKVSLPIAEYQALKDHLAYLRQRRMELLSRYTPSNRMITSIDDQVADLVAKETKLRELHPELAAVAVTSENGGTEAGSDLATQEAVLTSIAAKLENQKERLKSIDKEVERISSIGVQIVALEQQKLIDEQKYQYLESTLEKAKTDEALDPSKIPNISTVQQPSPPVKTVSKSIKKISLGLAAGGVGLGLVLAFLTEFVIDRRIRRPADFETSLQLPLLLSIPYVKNRNEQPLLIGKSGFQGFGVDSEHFIDPYAEAIRDRIIFNFGINNATHKPKFIGLTSITAGAGTSTIATRVAKAFSRVREMKVLLVDLSSDPDSRTNGLIDGKPLSLVEAIQKAKDPDFKNSNENLFVASAVMNGGAGGFAPMHLQELMPHFVRSDYDYIIFDMPMLDRISPTLAMAGLLDKVMLVLDADRTNRESLTWGYNELLRGRSDVTCVFNKVRSHAPKWIAGDM